MGSKVNTPTVDVIRRRLAAPRPPCDPRERLLGNIRGEASVELRELLANPGRPASVLLALLERPSGPTVLFTARAAHLKDHAGQVSLPGGRLAAGETPAEAALREAHEEVGLAHAAVNVIGTLDAFITGTGFMIMPVVGVVTDAAFVPTADPREVAGVFEVPLPLALRLRSWRIPGSGPQQGERILMQDGTTADMLVDVAGLVAFVSASLTLEPGDVLATGTPSGVGVFRDPPIFLEPGDRVRCEIEEIGSVENPVVEWTAVSDEA